MSVTLTWYGLIVRIFRLSLAIKIVSFSDYAKYCISSDCIIKAYHLSSTQPAFTYSKLTIKTPERRQWRRSGVFIVNFKHTSQLVLEFLLSTLNM